MATLAEYSGTRSREENVLVMDEAGVTFAPVLSAGDLVDPPYARGRGLFAEVEEGGQLLPLLTSVPQFDRTPGSVWRKVHELGAHTEEVLAMIRKGADGV